MDRFEVTKGRKSETMREMEDIEQVVRRVTDGGAEDFSGEGRDEIVNLLSNQLDQPEPSILVLFTCSTLLDSTLTSESISSAILPLAQHKNAQLLAEILMEVIETGEEHDADTKDEIEALAKAKKGALGEEASEGIEKIDSEVAAFSSESTLRSGKRLDLARLLLQKEFLSSELASFVLDTAQLPTLNILSAQARFTSNERRRRTNLFYKQKKYNLLRECSEGWSQLLVLLGDEGYLGSGGDEEDSMERGRRVSALWKRILSLIGLYDLSPPRVLDIILDAFCFRLTTHWRFFTDLILCSPWGKKDIGNLSIKGKGKQRALVPDQMDIEVEESEEAGITEFLKEVEDEAGNATLAQVLGFKYGHYQVIEGDLKGLHREVDATPRDLLLVTAILMREGLVRTVDILPHLTPDDRGMNGLAVKYAKSVKEQIATLGGNALMNSGPLSDDVTPASGDASTSKTDKAGDVAVQIVKKDLIEQRVLLCEALLAIGHLPPAFFLLCRWPVIAQSHPAISDLLLRIVGHLIQPAYAIIAASKPAQKELDPYRSHFAFSIPVQVATTAMPLPLDTEKRQFKFFFSEWNSRLTQWQSVEEVAKGVWPFAKFVGAMGARDVTVLVRICRVGVQHMRVQRSPEVEAAWLNIVRTMFLPSMPLLPSGYSFNNELWPLLKPFKYTFRYSLYGEWHVAMTDSFERRTWNPTMALAAARTMNDAKQVLKRMTSGLERAHARAIGKGSYSAPTAMWSVILPQISSYQNMIPTVVEGARYLSELGWDITIYMLLDALSDSSKDRVKDDGLSASVWLQGVASFIGTLAKRYSQMDLLPILQQVANQLKARSMADLITLKELIIKMANISPLQNVSPTQVACFSGGKLLYEEGIQVTRPDHDEPPKSDTDRISLLRANKKPTKRQIFDKSLKRLVNILLNTGLALPILIGIAQARRISAFVARERLGHTKQMSLAFDECQGILLQYLSLLAAGMTTEQYSQFIPSLRQLSRDFHLELAVTHHILRPKLAWQMENREEFLRISLRKYRKEIPPNEVALIDWEDSAWQPPLWSIMVDNAVLSSAKLTGLHLEPFFATFWQLALPELGVPEEAYRSSLEWLNTLAQNLNSWKAEALDGNWADSYKANQAEILLRADGMEHEREQQRKAVEVSHTRLQAEASLWFSGFPKAEGLSRKHTLHQMHTILHQRCFFPRSTFSMTDATFVAKFVKMMHNLNTANFSLIMFYDKFFDDNLGPCLFACTENEASNLARCLYLLVNELERWRSSEKLYKAEGSGEQEDGSFKYQGMRGGGDGMIEWRKFQLLCRKWHKKISRAICVCLESTDYIHVKNGIIVGRGLMPRFPKMMSTQQELIQACKAFLQQESAREDARDDLVILVKSYEDALAYAGRDNSASAIKLIADDAFAKVNKRQPSPVKGQTPIVPPANGHAVSNKVSETTAGPMDVDEPAIKVSVPTPKTEEGQSLGPAPVSTSDANQDLALLRERVKNSKAATKTSAAPTSQVSETSQFEISAKDMIGVPSGPRADVDKATTQTAESNKAVPIRGSATSQAPPQIPTEPRKPVSSVSAAPRDGPREPPKEPRSRQVSGAGEMSGQGDSTNIPKGPRLSSTSKPAGDPPTVASKEATPIANRSTSRKGPESMVESSSTNLSHAKTAPARNGKEIFSAPDLPRSRRTSLERNRTQRDPSADSKASRGGDRSRMTEPSESTRSPRGPRRDGKEREKEADRGSRYERVDEKNRDNNKERRRDREGSFKPVEDERGGNYRDQDKRDHADRRNGGVRDSRDSRDYRDDRKDRERGERERDDKGDRHRQDRGDKADRLAPSRDDRRTTDKPQRDVDRDDRPRERDHQSDKHRSAGRDDRGRDYQNRDDHNRDRSGRDKPDRAPQRSRDERAEKAERDVIRDAHDVRDEAERAAREARNREKNNERDVAHHKRSDRESDREKNGSGKPREQAEMRPPPPHLAKQAEEEAQEKRTNDRRKEDKQEAEKSRDLPPHLAQRIGAEVGQGRKDAAPIKELLPSNPNTSRSNGPRATDDGGAKDVIAGFASTSAPPRSTNGIRSQAAIQAAAASLLDAPLSAAPPVKGPTSGGNLRSRIAPAAESVKAVEPRSTSTLGHGLPQRPTNPPSGVAPPASKLALALQSAAPSGGDTVVPMSSPQKRPSEDQPAPAQTNKRTKIDREGAQRRATERGAANTPFGRLSGGMMK